MLKILCLIGIAIISFKFYSYICAGSRADKLIKGELERPDLIQMQSNGGTYGKY